MSAPTFYVGCPAPAWLARTDVPLFVSHNRLRGRKTFPKALGKWALDSGGFSEIAKHGKWTISAEEYVAAVRRYRDEIGGLVWAAPQDWMCEPDMIARTGLSVEEHQARTVANFVELRRLAPDLPFAPVVQGWSVASYSRCVELYAAAGVDLAAEPVVGVGSICRRQNPVTASLVLGRLRDVHGLRNLHAFGLKSSALAMVADAVASSDSQAWSFAARSRQESCPEGKVDCRNCMHYALEWREEVLASVGWPDEPAAAPAVDEFLDGLFALEGALF